MSKQLFDYCGEPINHPVYDSLVDVSYGLWVCPTCKSEFYGGGPAIHERECTETGYGGCEFHFGPGQVDEVNRTGRWYGITLEYLKENYPELVK